MPAMQLFTLGLNHQTAPLSVRERVVFQAELLRSALAELVRNEPVREAAILSTCNRTELYCALGEPQAALDWLAGYHGVRPQDLKPYLYTLPQGEAVRHAFRVASGLDSMVVGEPQILGQMKEAARAAESAGTLGTLLNKLFQHSFAVAKEVRSNTGIGANVVSMAAASVKLAARIFPSLTEQKVLLIGAGEMIELAATHFAAQRPRAMTVANRTLERAESLAHRFNAESMELRDLPERLPEYDIVISCTASSLPIIGKGMMERTLRARRRRPVFMVDLAVPRDIEAEVAAMDDVFVYTVDDLASMVREGMDARQSAVAQAEAIIESQVGSFPTGWTSARWCLSSASSASRPRTCDYTKSNARRGCLLVVTTPRRSSRHSRTGSPTSSYTHPPRPSNRPTATNRSRPWSHGSITCAHAVSSSTEFRGMKSSIAAKLDQARQRLGDINALLSSENATRDMEQYRKLSREHAELQPIVELFNEYRGTEQDVAEAQALLADPEMKGYAESEVKSGRERLAALEDELQRRLLPRDPNDDRNIFLEIRAGTGGDESALFAGDLFRMYARYAERQGWQVEVIAESPGEAGGYKEIIARIIGQGAYSRLKFESGGHRVQRVPATETQGRIHTSACTVAVLPEADAVGEVVLNPVELRIDTYRASGAGGQHVNKTDSAVRVTHLPTGIVVECQDARSQHKNKEKALAVLAARIKDKQRREQQAKEAATRKSLIGSGDRSERIRTYNFPQGRVTDHRIGLTLYKIGDIMDGDLSELTQALLAEHQTEQLAALTEER